MVIAKINRCSFNDGGLISMPHISNGNVALLSEHVLELGE